MTARLIVFLSSAAYLAVIGDWGVGLLALLGLVPGLIGLVGAVVFVGALFLTGHYVMGMLVAVVVAVVFYMSNTAEMDAKVQAALHSTEDFEDDA